MAASDALPIPRKNTAMRVTFGIFDADGDPVSGATGLDSEISKDGGSFTDCTNEATEIGSSGIYYLDLTSTEMNADTVAVRVQTSSSGAKTTVIVMYPEEAGDVRADVVAISGDSAAAAIRAALGLASANLDTQLDALPTAAENQSGMATASAVAALQTDATTLLSRVTGAVALAATALSNAVWTDGRAASLDSLDASISSRSTYAGGAVASVTAPVTVGTNNDKADYGLSSSAVQAIWDALTSALTTAGSIGKLLVDRIDAAISSRSTYAGGDTTGTTTLLSRVTALLQTKAEADTAHGLLATSADLATVAGYLDTEVAAILAAVDTEIAAIKLKTDNLPTDPADQSQVEAAITSAQGALAVLIGALNDIAGADVWAAMDAAAANKIADHALRRGWAAAATSADGDTLSFRSLLGAVAKLVNRVGIVGSTLTVYEDNDTTALGTQALTSDPAAEPVTGADTA